MPNYNTNSRYYNCEVVDDIPQCKMTKDLYDFDRITVQANESGRLDLISYRVYGTPVNWWIIARFNAIINQETVKSGDILKIPRL